MSRKECHRCPVDPGAPIRALTCGPASSLTEDSSLLLLQARTPADAPAFDCVVAGPAEARHLRETAPATALVVLASGPGEVREALRAGAHACLPAGEATPAMLRVAVIEAIERRGAPARGEPELLTLQAAATTLGVTQSRLRRWSDEGRIAAVRTAGGHRRFPAGEVRRLALELGAAPAVRPLEPSAAPSRRSPPAWAAPREEQGLARRVFAAFEQELLAQL